MKTLLLATTFILSVSVTAQTLGTGATSPTAPSISPSTTQPMNQTTQPNNFNQEQQRLDQQRMEDNTRTNVVGGSLGGQTAPTNTPAADSQYNFNQGTNPGTGLGTPGAGFQTRPITNP